MDDDSKASNISDFVSSSRIGDAVVAKYRVDGRFYRGIVGGIRGRRLSAGTEETNLGLYQNQRQNQQQNPEFFIFYLDYGNSDWVVADDVWPMIDAFASTPPLSVKCFLVGRQRLLLPTKKAIGDDDDDEAAWSKDDGDVMASLVNFDCSYRAEVVQACWVFRF